MNLFKFFIIALISMTSFQALAENEVQTKHTIDIWLEKNIDKDPSTVGMRRTINNAQQMWEAEMNKVYKRLITKLNRTQQNTLCESQRNWLKFRETEGKVILEIIAAQEGTIHQLSGTNRGMEVVRERALTLISYENELEN